MVEIPFNVGRDMLTWNDIKFVYLFKILKYLGEIFQYFVCLFVQDDEVKDMVGGDIEIFGDFANLIQL